MVQTCVVTPPAGLWGVAAASKAVQTQHVSSATWPVPATVLLLKTRLVIENNSQKLLCRYGWAVLLASPSPSPNLLFAS